RSALPPPGARNHQDILRAEAGAGRSLRGDRPPRRRRVYRRHSLGFDASLPGASAEAMGLRILGRRAALSRQPNPAPPPRWISERCLLPAAPRYRRGTGAGPCRILRAGPTARAIPAYDRGRRDADQTRGGAHDPVPLLLLPPHHPVRIDPTPHLNR